MRVVAALLAAGLAGLALAASAGARTAADVPIVGATAVEEAAIRSTLAPLGDHVAIEQLTLEPTRVLVASCGTAPLSTWTEASWQMTLLGFELIRRLAAAAAPIGGIGYCDLDFHPVGPSAETDDTIDLDAIAQAIRARARSNHLNVSIQRLHVPEPALRVVVHLYERQLFKRISSWRYMVFPPEADHVSRLLRVENPHGDAVYVESWARSDAAYGGFWRGYGTSDGDAPRLAVPTAPVPPRLRHGTRLTIRYAVVSDGGPDSPRPGLHRFRILCGAHPTGIRHARRVCETILRDRWALFVPQQLGSDEAGYETCAGGAWDQVQIGGRLGGRRLGGRSYFCEVAALGRWAALLGLRTPFWGTSEPYP